MEDTNTCTICAEKYNLTTRHAVPCEYCTFIACHKCTATYLLSQPIPRCMNNGCQRAWTRKHMTKYLSPTFRGREFKQHNENILFEKESAYFQDTQLEIEDDIRNEKLTRRLYELERKRLQEYNRIREEYEVKMNEVRNEMKPQADKKERTQFVQKCIYDNCNGFMSSQWKCGLCERYACSKCQKAKESYDDPNHTCNPDDIASVDAIRRETKPCPKCHTKIYKIHGCDQMWCTNCRTPFSWIHGTVINGPLHNPHYHEYLAARGQINNDNHHGMNNECGMAVPDSLSYTNRNRIERILSDESYRLRKKNLLDLCRNIQHVAFVEVNNYQIPTNELSINREDRKSFLRNEVDEADFKKSILKKYKENQKNIEMRQIMEMVRDALSAIYVRMADYLHVIHEVQYPTYTPYTQSNIDALLGFSAEIDGVRDYANSCVKDINMAYQSMSKRLFTQSFYFIVGNEDR